jgi:hypothetical protein
MTDENNRTMKILGSEKDHGIAGYEDYYLYKMVVVDGYNFGEGQGYILTQENLNIGDVVDAKKCNELMAPETGGKAPYAYKNMPLRVYRPEYRVANHYTVAKELSRQDWPKDLPMISFEFMTQQSQFRLFEITRKADLGYKPDVKLAFSKVAFDIGDHIRAEEIKSAKPFSYPDHQYDEIPKLNIHDEAMYHKNLWSSLQTSLRR